MRPWRPASALVLGQILGIVQVLGRGSGARLDAAGSGGSSSDTNPAACIPGQWTRLPVATADLYLQLQPDGELDGAI